MSSKVSIVIPCFNEENYIEECVLSLIKGDYKNIELLIVDGRSNDNSIILIKNLQNKYSNIKLISNPKRKTPISLNIGVQNATGTYIMIASSHSKYPSNYISFLLKELEKLKCDVIGGAIETRSKNSNFKSESIVKVLSNKFGVGNSLFRIEKEATLIVDTVPFGIYKKAIFDTVGLYNEQLIRNHDIELSKRIINNGFKIVLISSIHCVYYARENFSKLAKNSFSNGYWNILTIYITKELKSLSVRHFIPLIFILSLLIPILISVIVSSYFIIFSLLSVILYGIFLITISLKLRSSITKLKFILSAFLTLHFSYGIGSLCGLFKIQYFFNKN